MALPLLATLGEGLILVVWVSRGTMGLFSNSFVSASGVGAAGVESWYRNKEVLKQTINIKQCMFLRGPICYFIVVFPKRIAKIEK